MPYNYEKGKILIDAEDTGSSPEDTHIRVMRGKVITSGRRGCCCPPSDSVLSSYSVSYDLEYYIDPAACELLNGWTLNYDGVAASGGPCLWDEDDIETYTYKGTVFERPLLVELTAGLGYDEINDCVEWVYRIRITDLNCWDSGYLTILGGKKEGGLDPTGTYTIDIEDYSCHVCDCAYHHCTMGVSSIRMLSHSTYITVS